VLGGEERRVCNSRREGKNNPTVEEEREKTLAGKGKRNRNRQ
jgi:hypothetical protein